MAARGRPVREGAYSVTGMSYNQERLVGRRGSRPVYAISRTAVILLISILSVVAASSLPLSASPSGRSGQAAGGAGDPIHTATGGPEATVVPSSSSGRVGSSLALSGGGFSASVPLTLFFNGSTDSGPLPGACTSSSTGGLSCTIQVPALPAGPYYINVTDGVHNGSATFTILAPLLTLSPDVGQVSGNSTASGTGFKPGGSVTLTFSGESVTACESSTSLVANPAGNFSCKFQVPALPAGGPNPVNASDEVNTATATFYLNRPALGLTPAEGTVGSTVTATGAGFAPSETLSVTFGTTPISHCSSGSTNSNPFGELSCSFSVPILLAGTYLVNVSDGVNSALPGSFQVGPPFLSLSVSHGPVGTVTVATGSGYTPLSPVSLDFNSTPISRCDSGQLTTEIGGGFSCGFATPASVSGIQAVTANDTVNAAAAPFTVTASLSLSAVSGSFGQSVNASGTGFDGGATVAVVWNATYPLCSAVTGTDGSFSCSFLVPTAPAGTDTVTATEGHNAPTAMFQVESTVLLSSASRNVGQPEIASGYGFSPFESTSILWDHSTPECGGSSTDSNGAATCTFLVPASSGGEHNVSFVQGAVEVNRSVTVTTSFAVDPNSGVVGITVELIGTAFQASTLYMACLEASLVSCPSNSFSFTTSSNGSIPTDTNFTIPSAIPGSYDLVVSVGTMIADEAGFDVTTAAVSIAPTSGPVGTPVSLAGSGFAPSAAYLYCFQASATPCPSGTDTDFVTTASGAIPSGVPPVIATPNPAGVYYVDISQGTSLIGSGEFVLLSNVTANLTLAAVGAGVRADGTGFPTLTAYAVMWNSTVRLCAGTTNATGGFSCAFAVPPASRGAHEISAAAGSGLASFAFSVLPALSLSPVSGEVGSLIQPIGTGFDADAAYSVRWASSTTVCSNWTNASGSLVCPFRVPYSPAGDQTVSVVESSINVTAGFVVVSSLAGAPSVGGVGSWAEVTGTGFDAGTSYRVDWNTTTVLCLNVTNGTGSFTCPFTVPVAPGGPDTITAHEGSNAPIFVFTVTPSLEVSASQGPVGSTVLAAGTGFAAGAPSSFWWNSTDRLCGGAASSNGVFDCNFTVPATPAGVGNLTARDGAVLLTVQFAVVPSLVLSTTTGKVNSQVQLRGSGFDADASFTVAWNSTTPLCSGATTGNGSLLCPFVVPNAAGGSHSIVLAEGSYLLRTSFSVSPSVSFSQLNATAGASVTVTGEGFVSGEPYVVSMAPSGGTLCAQTANLNGAFVCTFVVPSVPYGMYTLTISQGLTDISQPFFVQPSAAPSPPTPFPWWLVAVVLVAALFGALAIYLQWRRRSSAPPGTSRPGKAVETRRSHPGGVGSLSAGSAPEIGLGSGPPSDATSIRRDEDSAARLFDRLVPIYREVLKSEAPEAPRQSPGPPGQPPRNDVDVLVERLGPIYEEVLKGMAPGKAPGAPTVPTSASAEEVRARIVRLVPAYRTVLKEKPPQKPT